MKLWLSVEYDDVGVDDLLGPNWMAFAAEMTDAYIVASSTYTRWETARVLWVRGADRLGFQDFNGVPPHEGSGKSLPP